MQERSPAFQGPPRCSSPGGRLSQKTSGRPGRRCPAGRRRRAARWQRRLRAAKGRPALASGQVRRGRPRPQRRARARPSAARAGARAAAGTPAARRLPRASDPQRLGAAPARQGTRPPLLLLLRRQPPPVALPAHPLASPQLPRAPERVSPGAQLATRLGARQTAARLLPRRRLPSHLQSPVGVRRGEEMRRDSTQIRPPSPRPLRLLTHRPRKGPDARRRGMTTHPQAAAEIAAPSPTRPRRRC